MGDRLAIIDMGGKWGLLCPFRGGAGSRLTQCGFGQSGGGVLLCLFRGGRAGSPSNAIWLWPRPTSVPSGILIYPADWPQQTWAENWGLYPFWGMDPHLTQCRLGAEAYLRTK